MPPPPPPNTLQYFLVWGGGGFCYKYFLIRPGMVWQSMSLLPSPSPTRPSPRLPDGPSAVLQPCSAALALQIYDNTLGDTPPDILGLTILIPTLIVWVLIVLAVFVLQERGCVNNPGHKHNKSPYC